MRIKIFCELNYTQNFDSEVFFFIILFLDMSSNSKGRLHPLTPLSRRQTVPVEDPREEGGARNLSDS